MSGQLSVYECPECDFEDEREPGDHYCPMCTEARGLDVLMRCLGIRENPATAMKETQRLLAEPPEHTLARLRLYLDQSLNQARLSAGSLPEDSKGRPALIRLANQIAGARRALRDVDDPQAFVEGLRATSIYSLDLNSFVAGAVAHGEGKQFHENPYGGAQVQTLPRLSWSIGWNEMALANG